MASYTPITNTLNFSVAFNPTSAFPIDARSMFGSYAEAVTAAASAKPAGSSDSVYYFGETLTVFANDVAKQYLIQGDGTLKETGAATLGDEASIELNSTTGILSLKSFGKEYYMHNAADTIIASGDYAYPGNMPANAVEGSYVQIGTIWYVKGATDWAAATSDPHTSDWYVKTTGWKSGLTPKVISGTTEGSYELAWYEPSSTTVEGLSDTMAVLSSEVSNITQTVAQYNDRITANTNAIAAEKTRAENAETALDGRVTTAEGKLDTLNGAVTVEGSVKKMASDLITEKVVLKTDIATNGNVSTTDTAASDAKVISEKAFVSGLTWKTSM